MRQFTEDQVTEIKEAYANGESVKKIRTRYSAGSATILNVVHDNTDHQRGRTHLTGSLAVEACQLYATGKSAAFVGAAYGVSERSIFILLRSHDIPVRVSGEKRKHAINDTYFDNIDTEEKAYWLGFIVADGCVTQKGVFIVNLSSKDKDHLIRLKHALGSGHPVTDILGGRAVNLTIGCKRLCAGLATHGVVYLKTKRTVWPTLRPDLEHHFARGYFDGDGCIVPTNFSIAGYEPFLLQYQQVLVNNIDGMRFTKLRSVNGGTFHVMQYGGNPQLRKIRGYLYKNASVYLTRKFVRFSSI